MLNGDDCGSLSRKCKVFFDCNSENDSTEIVDVSEPTTCLYEIHMRSPLACEKLDEDYTMKVYPILKQELQLQWDLVFSQFKNGLITEKVRFTFILLYKKFF